MKFSLNKFPVLCTWLWSWRSTKNMESSLLFTWRCADADELDFSCQGQEIVQVMYWTLVLHQFLLLLLDTKELKPSRCRIVMCSHQWHAWSSPKLALTHILSTTVWKNKLITHDYHCLAILNSWTSTTDHYQWCTQEFCWGGVQQIQLRTEDRENGDLGAVAP